MTRRLFRIALTVAALVGLTLPLAGRSPLQAQPPTAATPQPPPPQQPAPDKPPAPAGEPQTTPVFRTGVDLVAVDVTVVDKEGQPVRGLTADDFTLKVDGQPRPIASVEYVSQAPQRTIREEQFSTNEGAAGGRLLMIVIDQGNIRQGRGNNFVRSAGQLLDTLTSGDRVALAVIPGGRYVPFTNHFALVRQVLSRVVGMADRFQGPQMISTTEAFQIARNDTNVLRAVQERECRANMTAVENQMCISRIVEEAQEKVQTIRGQTESSLTAIRQILMQVRTTPGPKTLVVMSEGLIIERDFGDVSWAGSLSAAAQVTMYAIHLDDPIIDASYMRPSVATGEDRQLAISGLSELVGQARGTVFSAVAGTGEVFTRLSRELSGFYLVAFEPDASERDGKPHDIGMTVRRSGVEIRARRQFTASPVATARRADEEVLAEVLRDPRLSTEIRMRLSTYNFPDAASGSVRVLISVGAGRPEDSMGVRSVAYIVTNEDGKVVTSRVDQLPPREGDEQRYYGSFSVAPGTYTLKVAGVDADGRSGSVERLFTAAVATAGGLNLGDLMIGEPGEAEGLSLTPTIEPVLHGEAMAGYVELRSDDLPRLEAATVKVELAKEPNGPALVATSLSMAATRTENRRIARGEVRLAALPPGDYVARAVVSVSGRPVSRVLRPFTYSPRSEVRRAGLVADARGGPRVSFDRAQVLQAPVVGYFLDRAVASAPPAGGAPAGAQRPSATEAAISSARAGKFGDLAALPAGEGDAITAFLRGLGLYAKGDLEKAAGEFRSALRTDAEFTGATFFLGACYAAGGKDREAVGAWQALLAVDDRATFALGLTADAYTRLKDWPAAVELAQEAASASPEDGAAQLRLARALALAGRREESLSVVDRRLASQAGDQDMLLLGMKVLYDAAAEAKPVVDPSADRQRFARYLQGYKASGGPDVALAERWLQVFGPPGR